MPNLFNHNLIKTHIQNHQIDLFDEKLKVIQGWKKSIQVNKGVNEKALQAAFLQGIFGRSLGYKIFGEADEWHLSIEVSTEVDATTPDGILGFYTADESITQVVIELKSPRVSLDKKQNRAGKDYGTPVDQAFSYASKYDRCSWVIVSNMNEIRLYKVGRSQEYYESFFIDDLDNIDEFKKFHLLLCKENLIRKEGQSPTFSLSEKTKEHIQDISVSFYNLYKNIRIQLYEELKASNPEIDNAILVEKAQKFLDRIIFICFCEDLGLLPNNLLHHAIQRGKDSFSNNEYVIWQEIRGVFAAIDGGSTKHDIPAYNGGLFAFDEMLDNLSIKNNFFETIYEISAYDFGTDLDVNILGHIFEQSISDIEELKADVQNEDYDPQKSRRKKDGIFYTPSYITRYIVENSLGKYLEDIRKSLGEDDLPDIEAATTAQLEGRYKKKLLQFYRDYEEKLQKVKVLDPACGSGAFLNQAFDFLLEEYRWTHGKIAELGEGQISIFDSDSYQRSVLQNNLYGVDLNEESVEITKLSLWLKTADSRNALPYLDNNIKCGNSLIDDSEVAGDKAFRWEEEFPKIMVGGGFDVVIGNPPYIYAREKISDIDKDYYYKHYKTLKYQINTYVLFIEKAMQLIKQNGYLGYIVPDAWLRIDSVSNLRKYLLEHAQLKNVLRIRGQTFENVGVESSVFTLQNKKSNEITSVNSNFPISKGYIINQDKWLDNKNYEIDLYGENGVSSLLIKIEASSIILEKIALIKAGLKAYEKGKGEPKQTIEDVKSRPYDYKYKYDDDTYKYLEGKDIGRYAIKWGGQWLKYGSCLAAPRLFNLFSSPRILIREIPSAPPRSVVANYLEDTYLNNMSIINILQNDENEENVDLKYILGILNSKLISFYHWHKSVKAQRDLFPKITLYDLRKFPIVKASTDKRNILIKYVNNIIELKGKEAMMSKSNFMKVALKYVGQGKNSLSNLLKESGFKNIIYSGKTKAIRNLSLIINNNIVTIADTNLGGKKYELLKFEIKDFYKQQFLKLYLENLTEEQLTEINQYSGNILDKVMQITIPDYDKPEVVRKVVNEWTEIADLEKKIEETDKEIDQMVYELYGLTEDEIKIVEEETN